MINYSFEYFTLIEFLNFGLGDSDSVLDKFSCLPNAKSFDTGDKRFVFIEGTRKDKALLIAHADTVCREGGIYPSLCTDGIKIWNSNSDILGADDRAGCAILWVLANSGHSLLITAGEEIGMVASHNLVDNYKELHKSIQDNHQFAIQFDRGFSSDFKCYSVGTDEFREYVYLQTGYTEPNRSSFTDICTICTEICGVNLSVGYRFEHSPREYLVYADWYNTLQIAKEWLKSEKLPKFLLKGGENDQITAYGRY